MSLFTRERGFFGMHGYFKSLAEGARMDVPTIKKDQAAATFLLHFKYPIPLAYDIKTSWSGVRPVRFMFSTLNEGFYIVERENRKGKWRNAKEHLFVPTADYSD
jgi:hypothetical protein